MRPRFMNRGSASMRCRWGANRPRFNEAPIHESGKSGDRDRHIRAGQDASMRPRFMNRGSSKGSRAFDLIFHPLQ